MVYYAKRKIPLIIPEYSKENKNSQWHIFGKLREGCQLPVEPEDPFFVFGILPGEPRALSLRYAISAYITEAIAWFIMISGIGLNIFFIFIILRLFWGITF